MSGLASGFPAAWERYRTLVRGKLLEKQRQGELTAGAATMALRAAESLWDDRYDPCGSWLAEVAAVDELLTARVREVLRSFSFEEVPAPRPRVSRRGAGAIAAGGALAGAAVAAALQAGALSTVAAAAVPAALIYPAAASLGASEEERGRKEIVEGYLRQLELLREEVEGAIAQA